MDNNVHSFYLSGGKQRPLTEAEQGITDFTDYYTIIRKQLLANGEIEEDYVDDVAMELFKVIVSMANIHHKPVDKAE